MKELRITTDRRYGLPRIKRWGWILGVGMILSFLFWSESQVYAGGVSFLDSSGEANLPVLKWDGKPRSVPLLLTTQPESPILIKPQDDNGSGFIDCSKDGTCKIIPRDPWGGGPWWGPFEPPKIEVPPKPEKPKLSAEEIKTLVDGITDPKDMERLRLAFEMGTEEAVVDILTELMDKYKNDGVRQVLLRYISFYAANAEKKEDREKVANFLIEKLGQDEFKNVWDKIIEALGKSRTDAAAEALSQALGKTEFKEYESKIVEALRECAWGSVVAVKKLGEVLNDSNKKEYHDQIIEDLVKIAKAQYPSDAISWSGPQLWPWRDLLLATSDNPQTDPSSPIIIGGGIGSSEIAKAVLEVLGEALKKATDKERGEKVVKALIELGSYSYNKQNPYFVPRFPDVWLHRDNYTTYLPPFRDDVLKIFGEALAGSTNNEVKLAIINGLKDWPSAEYDSQVQKFFEDALTGSSDKEVKLAVINVLKEWALESLEPRTVEINDGFPRWPPILYKQLDTLGNAKDYAPKTGGFTFFDDSQAKKMIEILKKAVNDPVVGGAAREAIQAIENKMVQKKAETEKAQAQAQKESTLAGFKSSFETIKKKFDDYMKQPSGYRLDYPNDLINSLTKLDEEINQYTSKVKDDELSRMRAEINYMISSLGPYAERWPSRRR